MSKRDRLSEIIENARSFRFCGPSDDPDEQTAVTTGYRYLLVQLKRLATPLLPEAEAALLNAIEVDVNNIYSAYDAHAEIDALLPDIEDALMKSGDGEFSIGTNAWVVEAGLIERLACVATEKLDLSFMVRMCREINSCFAHGNMIATVLLMRAVLNYVPPLFEHETFSQIVANVGNKSLKENFDHLENGLRKIADFHTHRRIGRSEFYPSIAQIEPFKPQFELLLQQAIARAENG